MIKELQATCTYYGIKPEALKGKSRQRDLVKARKIFSNLVIEKYGFLKGLLFSLKRLSKCHPWHKGGVDLP